MNDLLRRITPSLIVFTLLVVVGCAFAASYQLTGLIRRVDDRIQVNHGSAVVGRTRMLDYQRLTLENQQKIRDDIRGLDRGPDAGEGR